MSSKIPIKTLTAFRKEARKTLWTQDGGGKNQGKQYRLWEDRINELEKTGLSRPQATIVASKEFPCLARLFRQFDVSFFDPDPTLSPCGTGGDKEAPIATQQSEKIIQCEQLTKSGVPEYENLDLPAPKPTGVVCEGIEQSHLDNLRWAATAAGVFMRTSKSPKTCPNDQAWFFYRMALEDHKAFLDKLHTVEMKAKEESDRNAALKKSGEVSIREIELMLDELKQEVSL